MKATSYIGRFAPSPSGPLHFGSLVCALASYLDAKANAGKWLVRMEDIDPPREQAGAAQDILYTLQAHGLAWDSDVLFQSTRSGAYQSRLQQLIENNRAYRCNCTRKRLAGLTQTGADVPSAYDGHCLRIPPSPTSPSAIRFKVVQDSNTLSAAGHFDDLIQGPQFFDLEKKGDFIIHRKDGFFAYQLAVVVDDIEQKISRVVRGNDLIDTTAQQRLLFTQFGHNPPGYAHIPVVVDEHKNKLSKQNHAPGVNNEHSQQNLFHALQTLGLSPPEQLLGLAKDDILDWGVNNWSLNKIAAEASFIYRP